MDEASLGRTGSRERHRTDTFSHSSLGAPRQRQTPTGMRTAANTAGGGDAQHATVLLPLLDKFIHTYLGICLPFYSMYIHLGEGI